MPTLTQSFEHELLELFHDPGTGITGAVAIHSTALGPAMGGLRLSRYGDAEAAAVDALRLARAMTLKNAAAGLDLGGGKAVLVDDGAWGSAETRRARMLVFADVLERLGGRYVTAEDVGTAPADMDLLATRTRWVVGRSPGNGGRGDPSPATARTVLGAISAAVLSHLGTALDGVHVGVLGAGKVGAGLVARLAAAGARVTVADIDRERARACAAATPSVTPVPLDGFLTRDLDVLAPCALGELIAVDDVAALRCSIVAGAANNPLVDRATAVALHDAGILYVPDFIANGGGIVHVAAEFRGLAASAVDEQIEACVRRTREVLDSARSRDVMPLDVAIEVRRRSDHRSGRATTDVKPVKVTLMEDDPGTDDNLGSVTITDTQAGIGTLTASFDALPGAARRSIGLAPARAARTCRVPAFARGYVHANGRAWCDSEGPRVAAENAQRGAGVLHPVAARRLPGADQPVVVDPGAARPHREDRARDG